MAVDLRPESASHLKDDSLFGCDRCIPVPDRGGEILPREFVAGVRAHVAEEGDGVPDHGLQALGVAGGGFPGGARRPRPMAGDDRAQAFDGTLQAVDEV